MPTLYQLHPPERDAAPSDALRSFVFASNLAAQDITGDTAASATMAATIAALRGNSETRTRVFALDDDEGYPLGFVQLTDGLIADTTSTDLSIVLDAELQPLPEEDPDEQARQVFRVLLQAAEAQARANDRPTIQTWLPHADAGHRFYHYAHQALLEHGYTARTEEVHGWITLSDVAATDLPEHTHAVLWENYAIEPKWQQAVCSLFELADATLPHGSLSIEAAPWTPRRLADIGQSATERGNTVLSCALIAGDELVAYSDITRFATGDPSVAWQGLSIVAPDARRRGYGRAVKSALLRAAGERMPKLQRVCSQVAISNEPMLALNASMGFQQQTRWVALERTLD